MVALQPPFVELQLKKLPKILKNELVIGDRFRTPIQLSPELVAVKLRFNVFEKVFYVVCTATPSCWEQVRAKQLASIRENQIKIIYGEANE